MFIHVVAVVALLSLAISTGRAATYQYDAAGRLIEASYSESVKFERTYDKAGNITKRQSTGVNHTITASSGENGTISPSGAVVVSDDADQAFVITPDDGYAIQDVLVDDASVGAVSEYTFENVTADHAISASFAKEEVTLTMSVSPAASGATDPTVGAHTVNPGEAIDINATAGTDYGFVSWTASANCVVGDASAASTTVTLSGDGELTAIFSKNASSALAITYPNGGEIVPKGETVSITWVSSAELSSVSIELVKDGVTATTLATGEENDGSYDWTVGEDVAPGRYYKIKITGTPVAAARDSETLSDESDDFFSIVGDAYLVLGYPQGGEILQSGTTANVTWESTGVEGTVDLLLFQNGVKESAIVTATENDGTYEWAIPTDQSGTEYRLKIVSSDNASVFDQSASNFAIVGATSATLTMAVSPAVGGETDPAVGANSIATGVPTEIEATAAAGYKFVRWFADDSKNADIASPTSSSTFVTLLGDAVVTAIFAVDDSESGGTSSNFASAQLKINAGRENADSIKIVKGGVPDELSADDVDVSDFDITLMIDDYKLPMTEKTGTLKRKGDKPVFAYSSGKDQDEKVKLVIDLTAAEDDATDSDVADGLVTSNHPTRGGNGVNRHWSCRVSKASVGGDIDGSDGVDVYLDVNGTLFGNTLEMDEQTRWIFTRDDEGANAEVIDVTGTPMSEFDILNADGRRLTFAELDDVSPKDAFRVKKGTIDALDFDPTTDVVTIHIDNWGETLLDDEAWSMKGDAKAVYKEKADDGATLLLYLDLGGKSWKFSIKNVDFQDDIDASDGIDVKLRVGDYEGGLRLEADQVTTFKYPPKGNRK